MVVERSKQALLPEKVAVQRPEKEHRDEPDASEFDPPFPRQQDERGGDEDDAPLLDAERVGREAVDDPLNELQVLEFASMCVVSRGPTVPYRGSAFSLLF